MTRPGLLGGENLRGDSSKHTVPWKISLLVLLWLQSAPFVCCCQTLPQGCTGHKPHAPNLSGQLSSTNHIKHVWLHMIHYKQYQVVMPSRFYLVGLRYCYPGKSCSYETITQVRNFHARWCHKLKLK